MDTKDWIIVGLLLAALGGPLGVHWWHLGKGKGKGPASGPADKVSDTPPGAVAIDDARRLGSAVAAVGGRAFTEGAKAANRGPKAYGNREHAHEHLHVGGTN